MDVTQSLGTAWRRTSGQLFRPFQLGAWFSFGVIFFLQALGEGGLEYYRTPNFSSRSRGIGGAGGAPPNLHEMVDQARHWIADNGGLVVGLLVVALVVGGSIGLVLLWLGTRGQMMAIRAVATGRPAIGEHWRETLRPAWSLFRFRIMLSLVSLVLFGPLLVLGVYRFVDLVDSGVTDADALVIGLLPFVVLGGLLAVVFAIIAALLRNFVAPIMLHFGESSRDAWRHFFRAASGSWGSIFLFFVIRAALAVGAGVIAFVLTFCTCCIGALPVLQQTLLAPWLVFERAYGLYALESLGPEFQMMQPIADPTAPQGPPGGFYPPPPPAPYPPPPPPAGTWGAS